jgi:hypothetical protein
MSAALPSYVRSNSTSGAMYSGVPQVDLDTDWPASSLENPAAMRGQYQEQVAVFMMLVHEAT